jgi:hypothetical protein
MSETPTYADVQARAKELGIADVVGKKREPSSRPRSRPN